ncbi:ABC transporter substrate-binding protein [Paradevosia shaoguanensis]|uniref:ABC transporter substrate-binding protein n=1 Tax=Paradevosia shaoguanensis TaxID=1335043 RepID=UPI0005047EB2|nr:nitrate ABC transporter substrate-binding protein [Devosia sp. 17-2-E-8]MBI4045231.1 ABC transporter substrate-binding protein [Devosia nanyangense]
MSDLMNTTGISRRRLLQITSAGVVVSALGLNARAAMAQGTAVRWVSPRGTLEVVDDFAYWVAKKMGYFGDVETVIEAGPQDGTATVKLVDQNQSDFGYPSPGVLSLGLEQGMKLTSAFHIMAGDVFDFAFQKGKAPADLKGLEGKTIVLGSAGWQSIADPMLAAAGVDLSKVKYVEVSAWGQALAQGQADAALTWEGLRAQWRGQGLDFDYLLGKNASVFPANSFVVRSADLEDPAKVDLYTRYLRGWAQGLEFGWINPAAATQIAMEQFPGLATQMNPAAAVESLMQQSALMHAHWDKRGKWGYHLQDSWQAYFDAIHKIGQVSQVFDASKVTSNALIDGANDFDHAKIKADAEGFQLSPDYAAVDVAAIAATV